MSAVDDAISQEGLKSLIKVSKRGRKPLMLEAEVRAMAQLGLRAGELVHLKRKWVDFENETIRIPGHDPCDCSYCQRAFENKQNVIIKNNLEKRKKKEKYLIKYNGDIPSKLLKECVEQNELKGGVKDFYWQPKYPASKRTIYFGFDIDLKEFIKSFFEVYDYYPCLNIAIWKHVKKMGKEMGNAYLHPHALRATAGIHFADMGLNEFQLTAIMGWESVEEAKPYIRLSGYQAAEALKRINKNKKQIEFKEINYRVFSLSELGKKTVKITSKRYDYDWLYEKLINKNLSYQVKL